MASVDVSIMLQVWLAGPYGLDVPTMLMGALETTGMSLTSTNHARQSGALLWAPDNHSKLMSYVQIPVTLFYLWFVFYHLETSVWVCGYGIQQCQILVDSSFTLLQHSSLYRLPVGSAPFALGVYECEGEKCNWKFLAIVFW